MAINSYYQDELQYLRDVGPEFSRANPQIARYLADRGSDPDVERILEGVAFLTGRIRQKLDDELPELTATMMSLLWPHYLRPIPSMSILELIPDFDAMSGPLRIEAGAQFASVPVDDTRCRYRSAWPMTLRPWWVEDVRLLTLAAQPVELVMTFRTPPKIALPDLELDRVRLHLAGDPRPAFLLYLLLAAHVEKVTLSDGSDRHDRPERILGPEHVAAAGLDRSEGVLPYPRRSFLGYRLLQEYFAFKERFLFVDLLRLDRTVTELELTDRLEVKVTFNRRFEDYPMVAKENVRLHCVPIINLLEQPAEPIRLTHDRTEYLIQPSNAGVAQRQHLEVFSVDQVTGVVRTEGMETRPYSPFYSFEHQLTGDPNQSAYYQTSVRPNVLGRDMRFGTDTYVSFVSGRHAGAMPEHESISLELTCTNRHLPGELRAGDITEPTDHSPPNARFRNILRPTPTVPPPIGRQLHWRLISHLSLNYVSLSDAAHFKELLRVYDFQSEHDQQRAFAHQRMLDGITSIKPTFTERVVRGAAMRGTQIDITLNEDHFAGEGDAFLFGAILDQFMRLYATINAFTQVRLRFERSGQEYIFPPRAGEQFTPAPAREA